jgi:phospholipase C
MNRQGIRRRLAGGASLLALACIVGAPAALAQIPLSPRDLDTTTPIKHVIVIYGENRSFDHLYATYKPVNANEKVWNLLSEGIVNEDGTPGPNVGLATQRTATDANGPYSVHPKITGAYKTLPPLLAGGAQFASDTNPPPFATLAAAAAFDQGLLPQDLKELTTGATGIKPRTLDTRLPNAAHLPNAPFQLTPGISYDAYASSPVHRYYQMFQQLDCDVKYATATNPTGCKADLFPWVEVSIGAGNNGKPQPTPFTLETTGEGSTSMGFYNVLQGDMPFFKLLSDKFTTLDNYHQPGMGGTGLDHILAGFGDAIWYSDGKGHAKVPPADQIENPNPQPGTANWYVQDGYGGGSYSACADTSQPGVGPVVAYLQSLAQPINPNCEPGHYYLLNNYNPGYNGDGTVNTSSPFTIPPTSQHSIGDVLLASGVSFRWYGEGWNTFAGDPSISTYCNICSTFLYQTQFMTNPLLRGTVMKDVTDFYNDVSDETLPAVSFVKPGGLNDGHPASSKFDIFEAFTKKILLQLNAHPDLKNNTAVLITVDEGGGYYDSGYVQMLDWFGDGTRIPLIVVSKYSTGGHINHTYTDHVSILKFIEANWGLPTISNRSRDNLPNPVNAAGTPYVPANSPAIGDLMDAFNFKGQGGDF